MFTLKKIYNTFVIKFYYPYSIVNFEIIFLFIFINLFHIFIGLIKFLMHQIFCLNSLI